MSVSAIPLWNRRGRVIGHALVDRVDAPLLRRFRWFRDPGGYARSGGLPGAGLMHRFLLDAPRGLEVDHINRVKHDNRRVNLRLVTHAQQVQNVPSYRGSTSRFRGVCWKRDKRRWQVRPRLNGKYRYVGYFTDEVEAAIAAEAWRREHMPFATPDPELALALAFPPGPLPIETSDTLVATASALRALQGAAA